jgi:hypothetical protein
MTRFIRGARACKYVLDYKRYPGSRIADRGIAAANDIARPPTPTCLLRSGYGSGYLRCSPGSFLLSEHHR